MAIALDGWAAATFSGAGPYTMNFQCGGTQRLLAVLVAGMRGTDLNWSWSSVSFNGVGLSQQAVNAQSGNNRNVRAAVWTLVNPAAGGTYQLSVLPNVSLAGAEVAAMALTGVDQSTPVGAAGTHAAQTNAFSTSLTTGVADAWLVGGAGIRNGTLTWTPGTGVTELFDLPTGSSATDDVAAWAGYRACAAAGSYALAATASGTNHGVLAAVEIRPAAAAPTGIVPILFGHYARMIQG